jgi:tRNA (adenine57-N1/adenine58-N1)-methyltransferase
MPEKVLMFQASFFTMNPNLKSTSAQLDDLALFIDPRGNKHIHKLTSQGKLQSNHGQILFADVIGLPWGSQVQTHLGKNYLMVQPSIHDLLLNIRRAGTIMYPKDMGFILVNMNITSGTKVIEAGTGSGAFTMMLALTVGPEGHIYSYDNRDDMQVLARRNLETIGVADRVTFRQQDIGYGFDQTDVDALFLDLPNPEDYVTQVREALKPGGFFGCLLPTTNQVSRLLDALQAHNFAFIEVCENLLRYYKPVPARLRPDDRMVAHTGFLVFARPILPMKLTSADN